MTCTIRGLFKQKYFHWAVILMFTLIFIQGIRGTLDGDGHVTSAEIPLLSEVYKGCFYRTNFGVDCPTCGMSRGFYSFFDGHIIEALGYNPMIVIVIPMFLLLIVNSAYYLKYQKYSTLVLKLLYVLIGLLVVFFVYRGIFFVNDMRNALMTMSD